MCKAQEKVFQDDIIQPLLSNGWLLGQPSGYTPDLALYDVDLLGFVTKIQGCKDANR